MQLLSAELPASQETFDPTATGATAPNQALLRQVASQAAAELSAPFGPQALVWDIRVGQLAQRAQVNAYLSAEAQQRAQVQAYLQAVAVSRRPPPPVVTAARSATSAPPVANPLAAIRQCESGGNYGADTGNGYFGAYQFNLGTWRSLGFGGLPSAAPPAVQDRAAQELAARRGWGQWPSCARRLGLT
jgi:Transglycosylase-like domain